MTSSRSVDTALVGGILLAVPLVYWPELKDYTLAPKLIIAQIALIAILARFALQRCLVTRSPLLLPATAYVLVSALSIFLATDPVVSVLELAKITTGFTLFLVVSTREPNELESCFQALVVAAAASAVLGIFQHLNALPWTIPSAGLPSGTLGFRNIAAMVTIQTIPFAIYFLTRSTASVYRWAAVLTLLLAFLVQTRSRGAWLGLLIAIVVGFIVVRFSPTVIRIPRKALAISLVLGVLLGAIPPQTGKLGPQDIDEKKTTISDTIGSVLSDGGDRGRTMLWKRTLEMIVDQPFGVGLGNWAIQYPRYDSGTLVTFHGAPARPHNDYLWIASESGIVGLGIFIWLLAVALRAGIRGDRDIALAAAISLVALMVHSCFSFPRDRATPTLIFWFVLGILGSDRQRAKNVNRLQWLTAAVVMGVSVLLSARLFSFESHLHHARAPEQAGDWKEVARHTSLALETGRFHSEAIHLHGYALNAQGDFEGALAHYSGDAHRRPHDVQFLNGYAIALQNTGNHTEAIAQYQHARDLVAPSTDLDYNLATLLIQAHRPDEAIELLVGVARSEPLDAAVQFHLGNAHALTGRAPEAIEHLRKALELEPLFPQAWMILGETYYRAGRSDETLEALESFLGMHKTDDAYSRRARRIIKSLGGKEVGGNE